jgi:hypothetical protein
MAIQQLSREEMNEVSGGLAVLLPGLLGPKGLVTELLGVVTGLLSAVLGLVTGLLGGVL